MAVQKIKNIIFDLGNVLLDIDYSIMEKHMQEITGLDLKHMDEELLSKFYKFETGKIPYVVFFNYVTSISPKKALINEMQPAWNSMLLDIQPETWSLLKQLSKSFDLYVMSNTNEIHVQWLEKYLQKNYSLEEWKHNIFKKIYYSHEIGYRKPDIDCFDYILKDRTLNAAETLFIDDVALNVEGADRAGINTVLFDRSVVSLAHLIANEIEVIEKVNN